MGGYDAAGRHPVDTPEEAQRLDKALRQLRDAREMLELTGADPIFTISSVTQEGMEPRLAYLAS